MNGRRSVHAPACATPIIKCTDRGCLDGRYSRSIAAIENLLTTWKSMSPVQQASLGHRERLILGGEAILSEELLAWQRRAGELESRKAEESRGEKGNSSGGEQPIQKRDGKDTEVGLLLVSSNKV